MTFAEQLGKNIKMYLAINDMSMSELARKLDVSTESVSKWCQGKYEPKMSKVDAMCRIFGVTRAELCGEPYKGSEIEAIFSQLNEANRAKLLELARLYLADQDRK